MTGGADAGLRGSGIPRLHLVTDDGVLRDPRFVQKARAVLDEGGEDLALHLRGPRSQGRDIHDLAAHLREPAALSRSMLLVNDRLDVVLALGLRGGHLGQRSLAPEVARKLVGPERVLGLSVHSGSEALEGKEGVVDFLLAGTVYPSTSHPGGEAPGPERIREILGVSSLPVLAIGGVTPGRVPEVMAAGAHGVAVLSGVWAREDPAAAVRDYLDALREEKS
jgi:thiazole tautomerase (transcriptional regulator TenI)